MNNLAFLPRWLIAFWLAACCVPVHAANPDWNDDPDVRAFVGEMHERHGFDESGLRTLFSRAHADPVVLRLIAPPSHPAQRSWQRFRARFLTPRRIGDGVAFWAERHESIERAARQFGVPAEIIVAIIGVETEYGRNVGNFGVFQSLATLAFRYPPRAAFFREELEQFLLLARENRLDPEAISGSYAGAIGIPQFMPGSWRRFAVDFDADGRIDLAGSPVDAIGSVASFLVAHGWVAGAPIARRAAIGSLPPPGWVEAGIRPTLEADQVRASGHDLGDLPQNARVALVDLTTPGMQTEYWWGFDNFYVITRYNRSSFYAMSVFELAEAIAGERKRLAAAEAPPVKRGSRAKRRRAG